MAETLQDARKQAVGRRVDKTKHKCADLSGIGAARGLFGLSDPLNKMLGAGQQNLTGGRQFHTSLRALEQPYADVILNLPDLARQRRLRDVQPRGRAAEMQLLSYSREIAKLFRLEQIIPQRYQSLGHIVLDGIF